MMVNRNFSDNLKQVSVIKNRQDRIEAARKLLLGNNTIATFVQYTYHPNVTFFDFGEDFGNDLDEPEVQEEGPMYRAVRSLKYLSVTQSPNVSDEKRRSIFLGMLSAVKRSDAALLKSAVIQRKLPYKSLGEEFFREAIPELFPSEEKKEN